MEAEAWAWLAVRSLRELPITYPGTTGVMVGDERLELPTSSV
jgi:1,6-anhydro-N-acetylmuramate kinase